MVLVRLVDSEDLSTLRMQRPVSDKIINGAARQKSRVQLQKWFRPQFSFFEGTIHRLLDALISNLDKTLGIAAIIFY